jgi:hypothetical protein
MVEFKRHSGLKVGESRLMLVRKVSSGVCEYAQAEAGCNGPMAVARELRRVTPDRCMEAAVRVAELCQEAADALERPSVPLEREARELVERLRKYGARYGVPPLCLEAAAYIERTAQAQGVTERERIERARELIGARNDRLCPAAREANINAAWHILTAALNPKAST